MHLDQMCSSSISSSLHDASEKRVEAYRQDWQEFSTFIYLSPITPTSLACFQIYISTFYIFFCYIVFRYIPVPCLTYHNVL